MNNTRELMEFQWLSWGNSWISTNCNWSKQIFINFNIKIQSPTISCLSAVQDLRLSYRLKLSDDKIKKIIAKSSNVARSSNMSQGETISHEFPCKERPIIFHHHRAGDILLNENKPNLRYICESMLLIDKVKEIGLQNYKIDDYKLSNLK